jgi:hypothetical protein
MPRMTINMTTENFQRIVAGLADDLPRDEELFPGETDGEFVKRWLRTTIGNIVKLHEQRAAAAPIQHDDNLLQLND